MTYRWNEKKKSLLALAAFALLVGLTACDMGAPGAGLGATPGGVQDMGFARKLIDEGQVPPPEAFVVEGMFSEHDLPLQGEACASLFCARGATGVAPTLAETPAAWVQLGLSSSLSLEEFSPDPMTLIATVDISGSMGWDYGDDTPAALATDLLHRVVDELRPEDQLAVVTYGSVSRVALEPTSGAQKTQLHAAVDGLGQGGSTNMEEGMRTAYELARGLDRARVVVLTDVQPNVGLTEGSEFEQLVRDAEAADGTETTVIACGAGVGQEVLLGMSHLRGANAFSLMEQDDVAELMEDDWPYFTQPLAYDLRLAFAAPDGMTLGEGYGFPSADEAPSSTLEVSTVFLSKRRGALLVRLDPEQGGDVLPWATHLELSYEERDGQPFEKTLALAYDGQALDERGHFYEQSSVGKTVALAVLVDGMRVAAELYPESPTEAIAQMERVLARATADGEALQDEAFDVEIELAQRLLELMSADAQQGDLYGGY